MSRDCEYIFTWDYNTPSMGVDTLVFHLQDTHNPVGSGMTLSHNCIYWRCLKWGLDPSEIKWKYAPDQVMERADGDGWTDITKKESP